MLHYANVVALHTGTAKIKVVAYHTLISVTYERVGFATVTHDEAMFLLGILIHGYLTRSSDLPVIWFI